MKGRERGGNPEGETEELRGSSKPGSS